MATPNALTYNLYVTQLANLAVVNVQTVGGIVQATSDAAWFNTLVPQVLNYAELRIQRDLDLEALLVSKSYTLTSGANTLSVPVADFVTLQSVGLVVNGALIPLLPTSKEYIQNVWGDSAATAAPQVWAPYGGDLATWGNTSTIIIVGPNPDQDYSVGVTGTTRAQSLYAYTDNSTDASEKTTFISAFMPDLLLQASMIMIAEYQRDYGGASNDPEAGSTYELQYQNLLKTSLVEEARKRWQAPAWASQSPALIAAPSR